MYLATPVTELNFEIVNINLTGSFTSPIQIKLISECARGASLGPLPRTLLQLLLIFHWNAVVISIATSLKKSINLMHEYEMYAKTVYISSHNNIMPSNRRTKLFAKLQNMIYKLLRHKPSPKRPHYKRI